MKKMNIPQLKQEIYTLSHRLTELKGILRESHQPRKTRDTQMEFERLRRQVTRLCSIRALNRGKIHMRNYFDNLDDQIAYIGNYDKYMLEVPGEEERAA